MFDIMTQEHLADLYFHQDSKTGLQAIIAIHSTRRGPALGGCRFISYPSTESAVEDAARLARGMSYKAALADIPHGGGKAVILKPPSLKNRRALMEAFGDFIDTLHGRYITAVDVGTSSEDMDIIATHSHYVSSTSEQGNPSAYTARGVMAGIRAAAHYRLNRKDFDGLHVAIQGLGQVGLSLARQLVAEGARLTVADFDSEKVGQCIELTGATAVSPDAIINTPCDVFSPCALGNVINGQSLPNLQCSIIAGSANNQLADEKLGKKLLQQDILYVPDFAINAGGLIYAALHHRHCNKEAINHKIDAIATTLGDIFQQASHAGMATNMIANRLAEAKLYLQSSHPQSWIAPKDKSPSTIQHNALH